MIDKEAWQQAPCGQCTYCRIQRAAQWAVRLMHEYATSHSASFITLTYEDENLPLLEHQSMMYPTLEPAHTTKFIKKLRKTTPNKLKYFLCGEYGAVGQRPHYHLIVFNYPIKSPAPRREISDIWRYGSTHIGTVTYESCRYVAGYIMKKWYGDERLSLYYPSFPPFGRQSQGLGLRFAQKNEKQLLFNAGTTIQGQSIGLPRYYRNKLIGDDKEKLVEYYKTVSKRQQDNDDLHLKRLDPVEKVRQYKMDIERCTITGSLTSHEVAERSKERSRRQFNENLNSKNEKMEPGNL